MKIEVTSNSDEVADAVAFIFSDQLPFATSRAVFRTAIDFQNAQRARLHDIFTIRRKRFAERSIKFHTPEFFSVRNNDTARLSVDSPGGKSYIFTKFETDRIKSPFRGNSIAVPTEHVPTTGAGVIKKGWRPRELMEGATQHGAGPVIRSRGNVFRGKKDTVLIRRPGGRGTLFQADPSWSGKVPGLKPLYQLVPRVRIEPELEFVRTAKKTVDERWQANFTESFDQAIRTARL